MKKLHQPTRLWDTKLMFWPACPLQFEMKHWITRWFRPLAVTIICALAHTVEAQTNRANEIEYASPDQSVWSTKLNERGEPDNPLLSLATALFTKANIPWRSQIYPASRLFKIFRMVAASFPYLSKFRHCRSVVSGVKNRLPLSKSAYIASITSQR